MGEPLDNLWATFSDHPRLTGSLFFLGGPRCAVYRQQLLELGSEHSDFLRISLSVDQRYQFTNAGFVGHTPPRI